jgi:hypothetical protein
MEAAIQGFGFQRPGRIAIPGSKTDPDPGSENQPKFDRDTMDFVLEDTRLSTLQKKLFRETGPVRQLALATQVFFRRNYSLHLETLRRNVDFMKINPRVCESLTFLVILWAYFCP